MSSSSSHSLADLLAVRPFLHFWWARLTGQLASQMVMVALGWQMYELTGSACSARRSVTATSGS